MLAEVLNLLARVDSQFDAAIARVMDPVLANQKLILAALQQIMRGTSVTQYAQILTHLQEIELQMGTTNSVINQLATDFTKFQTDFQAFSNAVNAFVASANSGASGTVLSAADSQTLQSIDTALGNLDATLAAINIPAPAVPPTTPPVAPVDPAPVTPPASGKFGGPSSHDTSSKK